MKMLSQSLFLNDLRVDVVFYSTWYERKTAAFHNVFVTKKCIVLRAIEWQYVKSDIFFGRKI